MKTFDQFLSTYKKVLSESASQKTIDKIVSALRAFPLKSIGFPTLTGTSLTVDIFDPVNAGDLKKLLVYLDEMFGDMIIDSTTIKKTEDNVPYHQLVLHLKF